jgi:hypothetical protein
MANYKKNESGEPAVNAEKQNVIVEGKKESTLEERISKMENLIAEVCERIHFWDKPVSPPEKKNYNPDRVLVGGSPRDMHGNPL